MSEKPLVSICCITYNHVPFIRQCLDGFIIQKTNFPIEVLINDDASTDGTTNIIKEYEKKYPDIIKPTYQIENQYSKGISSLKENIFPHIQGKYIALCEGDDYWIDENKLQKQVDFMEANEDFSICFHNVKVYDENERKFIDLYQVPEIPEITNIKNLATTNYIHTPSVLYRNNNQAINDYYNLPFLVMEDYILHMLFAKYGKIRKLLDVMCAYRMHQYDIWSVKPDEHNTQILLKALASLIFYYRNEYEICAILNEQYSKYSKNLFPDIHNINNELIELNNILNSKSWRYTKPLRNIYFYIKNNKILYSIFKYILLISKKNNDNLNSLYSFSKKIKHLGGKVYGDKILSNWDKKKLKKTIFLISNELDLTGAPIALYYFAEYLINNNYQPIFFSPTNGSLCKLLIKNNIPVIIYENIYNSNIILDSKNLYDLLIICTILGNSLISLLNNSNIKTLWWIHESFASYTNLIRYKLPNKLNENIKVFCGGNYAESILKHIRPLYKIKQLLYYVPDIAQSINNKDIISLKKEKYKCVFAIVGTIDERKGQDILIQAIRLLSDELIKKCLFIIIGKINHLPFIQIINNIKNDYPNNFIYIKYLNRNKLFSLYQQMDCLICSSRDDPMPIVVTEAMQNSKIIICSENTGSARYLEEMNSGLIYKNNSPEELSKLICYVIDNKNNLLQMCIQARKTYEQYFTQNIFNNSIKIILDSYLNYLN